MKFLLFLLLLIFYVPSFIYCNFENRIIGGYETPLKYFHFLPKLTMAGVKRFDPKNGIGGLMLAFPQGHCSSTIISKRHILTAAHCVTTPLDGNGTFVSRANLVMVDVRPAENESNPYDYTKFGISSKIYFHRGYGGSSMNDIAIIEFPEGTNFNVTPITLAKDYVDNYDDTVIAAGYGRYKANVEKETVEEGGSPTLRHVEVNIHPIHECAGPLFAPCKNLSNLSFSDQFFCNQYINKEQFICAGNYMRSAKEGDSGGPLLYQWNDKIWQIGIASHFHRIPLPLVYIRISKFCGWIEMITKGEARCTELDKLPKLPTKEALKSSVVVSSKFEYIWIFFVLLFCI